MLLTHPCVDRRKKRKDTELFTSQTSSLDLPDIKGQELSANDIHSPRVSAHRATPGQSHRKGRQDIQCQNCDTKLIVISSDIELTSERFSLFISCFNRRHNDGKFIVTNRIGHMVHLLDERAPRHLYGSYWIPHGTSIADIDGDSWRELGGYFPNFELNGDNMEVVMTHGGLRRLSIFDRGACLSTEREVWVVPREVRKSALYPAMKAAVLI